MSIPQRRMYFYLLDEQERIFKSVGRRAIQKIDESLSITDTNIISKSAGIEYISEDVQTELDRAMYVAIPRFRESDLYDTYEGPTRYDFYYIAEGSHDGNLIVLTLHESGMEELNASITGSRMSAQDSEGRDIEVSARSVIPGILSGTNFNFSWNSSSSDTSIFTYDTEPVSAVLEDFVRVYGLEMEYVVEFDGSEVSERIIKFYDEIGHGSDRPVDRISYAHDGMSVKKTEARDSIRTALIGIGSKKDVKDLPHQIVADNEIATRSQLGLSGTHMGRANWLSHSEAESLAEDSKALAESLGARRVQEQVVQSGMTLYESNINFKDYEFKKSEGFPVDKPKGQEYIEIPELTQINGIKTKTGMKPKVGVSKHTDVINIKELAWLAYHEILEVNRKRITYTASATVLNANIGDYVTVAYPNINLNDTKRVVNISRNRLDDTVEGITLGDHRAKSALRRAQEVQKKEEEEFVDTFMNQRPGGSNRTRSFNPLGTNFSPRDFGKFGRGNYGTIENPIGRDLFDSDMFESLGLEPGETVPQAIERSGGGDGGVGSGSSILREFEIQHSDSMQNGVYPLTMRPFDPRAWDQKRFSFEGIGVQEPDEEYEVPQLELEFPSLKKVRYSGSATRFVEGDPVVRTMRNVDSHTMYALFDNNPNLIKPALGYSNPPRPPSQWNPDATNPVVKLELDNIPHHKGRYSRRNPYPASLALYTRLNNSRSTPEGDRVGMAFNHVTGKVEVLQPGLAEELGVSQITDNLLNYRDTSPIEDGPVSLEALIDHRAISIVQFYMQSYIFPAMLAERDRMFSRLEGSVRGFAYSNFAVPLLMTIFEPTWATEYFSGDEDAVYRAQSKPGYHNANLILQGRRRDHSTGLDLAPYADFYAYADSEPPVFPWEHTAPIDGGIEYTQALTAQTRPYARYSSKY